MRGIIFWATVALIFLVGVLSTKIFENAFFFFAGYAILQATIMAVAWNILGGFTGYVNFGSAGFFAIGAYTSVALAQALEPPMIVPLLVAALIGGLVGLGTGYLTLRLRGVYFAIATLAMAIVFETFVTNWDYVGGATGAYIVTPQTALFFDTYIEFLFALMLLLALTAIAIARYLKISRIGQGLAAIRDDEVAAECTGVPTLRLKLVSTTTMGALMAIAGVPYPFFVTYVDPLSAFNLTIAVNAIAMPMIGGTGTWFGPVVGALLLGSIQEIATVTISSAANVLIVGILLVVFIMVAPQGIVGLIQDHGRRDHGRKRRAHG
ncbi:MAG: branched-chain amino acid ABC transporter permease [Geminicoccaceae bacterium]